MIEEVLNRRNMMHAYRQVVSNKGAAGVDGRSVKELYSYLRQNREQLESDIRQGNYLPQSILGVEIPKANGKKRLLGVPTVTDRLLQQAVGQVLAVKFELEFEDQSYGFRPNRNAKQAVLKAQEYINSGFQHIVDIDLKSFFDQVDHCILLQLIYKKVQCPLTLRLIRKWLRAPILIDGKLKKRRQGVPQGSPLSPLLSNIMLHELDKELKRQNLRFVRYADDFSIYLKTKSTARKVGNDIFCFLRDQLKLPINREKSGIRRPVHFKVLGYGFVPTYRKGEKGKYQLVASDKSWKILKQKVKTITRKTTPMSFDERIEKLGEVTRGWLNYFRMASLQVKLKDIDGWIRNRLRYCIWSGSCRRKSRTETEEPDPFRHRTGASLSMEPIENGGLSGSCRSKAPYWEQRLRWNDCDNEAMKPCLPITKKLLYILMNRSVRGPYAEWCEGFSARLLA